MSISSIAAILATLLIAPVIVLQLLLAAGLPLGAAAWGGRYRVLPPRLRLGSLVACLPLGLAIWVALARADLVAPGADSGPIRLAAWALAGLFALNTLGNFASKSRIERLVMTPATVLLVACFLTLAVSG